jgi:hypothetical protein
MTNGRGCEWGETSKAILYGAKYRLRTGIEPEEKDLFNFQWGKEHEPEAVEWLRNQTMMDVFHCSEDFEEIVFNQPFDGFGDSPDFIVNDLNGSILAVGEIKCPVDQTKIEMLFDLDSIDEKHPDYWQFIGHFIGCPEAKEVWYVVYDGYTEQGKSFVLKREDHVKNIAKAESRIKSAIEVVNIAINNKSFKIYSL